MKKIGALPILGCACVVLWAVPNWAIGQDGKGIEDTTGRQPQTSDQGERDIGNTSSRVRMALPWLVLHQSPDGRWDADGWQVNCRHSMCSGGQENGDPRYDAALTSLSLLAFLRNGHTHSLGKFKRTVNRGLQWLKRQQQANGSIAFDYGDGETIYNHAIGTMAICEAYAVSRDLTLKRYAERAVRFCVKAQNPNLGWKYGVRSGRNDSVVTGWMVLALKSARAAGLEVPDRAFTGARRWFIRVTDKRGDVGYENPGGRSSFLKSTDGKFDLLPTMTGVSVASRIFCGDRPTEDGVRKGVRILLENQPRWEKGSTRKVNFYYWYHGTHAMFAVGGEGWASWQRALRIALIPQQRVGGPENGSWDPVGEWCVAGGRVYATAIAALTLSIGEENGQRWKRGAK